MPASWTSLASKPDVMNQAFRYVEYDRIKNESVCDWLDLQWARDNRTAVVRRARSFLDGTGPPDQPRGHLYSWPKSEIASRRLVHIPFTSAVVRMALAIVIADDLDAKMIDTSFNNRRAQGEYRESMLLNPWADVSLPAWNKWKQEALERWGKNAVAAVTDLSAFYDMVSHERLLLRLAEEGGLKVGGHDHATLSAALRLHQRQVQVDGQEVRNVAVSGLATGGSPDAFLSNVYLMDLDDMMGAFEGIEYSRYCDDILIIGNDRSVVRRALESLERITHTKTLTLNAAKTELRSGRDEVEKMIRRQEHSLAYYEDLELDDHGDLEPLEAVVAFKTYDKTFSLDRPQEIKKDPAGFCKYVGMKREDGSRLLRRRDRLPGHIDHLVNIARTNVRAAKHAAWLIVESFIFRGTQEATSNRALRVALELVQDPTAPWHARARILHHLVGKPRGERLKQSWLQARLESEDQESILRAAKALPKGTPWGLNTYGQAVVQQLEG